MSIDTGTGPQIGLPFADPRNQIVAAFMAFEARLLNDDDLQTWATLLDVTYRYRVPIRTTRPPAEGLGFESTMHVDDDLDATLGKVRRLTETASAWAEQPNSRTRRFVTNIEVFEGPKPDLVRVQSSLLVYRCRGDEVDADLLSGSRHDVLALHDSDAYRSRLVERTVYLDQTVLGTPNLAIFF